MKTSVMNPHTSEPLFLIIDPVHNLKNIYNNFERKKSFKIPALNSPLFPSESQVRFQDLLDLYSVESAKPVRMAHKLSLRSLNPKPVEKTSVKLAAAIFHESTVNALMHYSEEEGKDWQGTARYLGLIKKLWAVLNVNSSCVGKRKRDIERDPVRSSEDWKLQFLLEFVQFLDEWESSGDVGLSKETLFAVRHTLTALVEMSRFMVDKLGFNYILLGKFQSDSLESRFGWYRQLSGTNYFISVKQLFESELKIKTLSLVHFSGVSLSELSSSDKYDQCADEMELDSAEFVTLKEALIKVDAAEGPVSRSDCCTVYFVTGAVIHSELRRRKCSCCSAILVNDDPPEFDLELTNEGESSFLKRVNRGGLLSPSSAPYAACVKAFSVFGSIKGDGGLKEKFLRMRNQRTCFLGLMGAILEADSGIQEVIVFAAQCENGHAPI
ncbi:MAG: hypothetical protein GY737_32715 [Desulfobacteraceae bacterium]|nr:hypothetical protein [Desulfobacteraceae bacterium]